MELTGGHNVQGPSGPRHGPNISLPTFFRVTYVLLVHTFQPTAASLEKDRVL